MVPYLGRCSGSSFEAAITLADPPGAHKPLAAQKSVHSGTTVTVQEEKVKVEMEEKGRRECGKRR